MAEGAAGFSRAMAVPPQVLLPAASPGLPRTSHSDWTLATPSLPSLSLVLTHFRPLSKTHAGDSVGVFVLPSGHLSLWMKTRLAWRAGVLLGRATFF